MRTIEVRTLSPIPIYVGVTDRGSGFKLPFVDGSTDHSTMVVGSDPAFCRWCRDYIHNSPGAGRAGAKCASPLS